MGLYDLETNEARLHTLGSVTVKDNCFAENAYYGLYNKRTDMTVDATLNWWGDPSGPRPLGTGDYAYDAPTNLAVSPWLVYDPTLAPPEVTLAVSPDPFSICLTLTATVESPDGVQAVDFYADGHHIAGPFTTEPYTCQWTPRVHLDVADYYPNAFGPRVVKAVASDLHGRTGEATCTVQHVPALVRPVLEDVTKWADLDPDTGPLEILDWLGGTFTYDQHKGTDFASPFGADVVAARDGVVEQVCNDWQDNVTTTDPSFGNFVAIRHAVDTNLVYYTIYAHLRHTETPIVEGDTVVVGDVIGQADHTGRSTAPHLHLEVRMGSMEAENYVCPYANGLIEGPATQAQ